MNGKKFVFLAVIVILTELGLNAQKGYQGPGLRPVTVQDAKSLRDESPVVLRGKIERFLGDEKYTFTDDSGSIIIEIDNRLWKLDRRRSIYSPVMCRKICYEAPGTDAGR
ncbi:MAG: NirD/YgiW/YdeI family stress tolerance protein [Spirochaetaceae bacterium]|jgi:uncharacterized protein YdeI (BOF family)|nr:NirD/YgiW/YdeI family stress tolerance protein [Spirochaetaceae bacterium]